jgi:molybdopterin adenylyltransferase
MSQQLIVKSLNISDRKGIRKMPIAEVELNNHGLVGDSHAGEWHRQVSLLGLESYRRFAEKTGHHLNPGDFAENITTEGVELKDLQIGDRFISEMLELEVTQIGKKCRSGCEIIKQAGDCIMPKEGIFCRVIRGGRLAPGDTFEFVSFIDHQLN